MITPGAGSLAGNEVPTLCGTLTGQHGKLFKMASLFQQIKSIHGYQSYSNFTFFVFTDKVYLDAGSGTTGATLALTTLATDAADGTKNWRVCDIYV